MKKSKFTETQIIKAIKEHESGRKAEDICRELGISTALDTWCKEHGITLVFIQPGKPMQNGQIERCNGSIRREFLNAYVFRTIEEVRQKAEEYRLDYNAERPHKSLGYVPPAEYEKNRTL